MAAQTPYVVAEKQGSMDGVTWTAVSIQYSDGSFVDLAGRLFTYYRMVFSDQAGHTITLPLNAD